MRKLVVASALVAASCASGVPVQRQVVVSGSQFNAVQGEASLLVRTFLPDSGGQRQEVLGATCTVVSSLYSADLVTPSSLVVPNFGPQSPELAVSCRSGDLTGQGRARIVTRWQQPPGYWGYPGGPLGGPGWGGWGWPGWGWSGPGFPISDYPNLNVTLQ